MISVCMPYFNRREHLLASIAAYRDLYAHLDLEIVICDDGSTPSLEDISGCKIVRLEQKDIALNPCVPINAAIRASTGDVIVLTNPEVVHTENVLNGMLAELVGEKDYVTVACFDPALGWLAGPKTKYDSGGRFPIPRGSHFHFCAMFRRSLFDEVGGFDEMYRFGQGCDDSDWLWKVYVAGANFKLAPGIVTHARAERTKWFGSTEQNAELLISKWKHLPEFLWSDSAHMSRMQRGWAGGLSDGTPCGSGSTRTNTAKICEWLPKVFEDYGISSLNDAGAGDMRWTQGAVLYRPIQYKPFDLVPREQGVVQIDISKTALPKADAILCRHVLIHMDPPRICETLRLFQASGARYLIASQYWADDEFDPAQYFHRTDLCDTYGLGMPLEWVADTDDEGCFLAIWDLASLPIC